MKTERGETPADWDEDYDPLDEALTETFPASDPIAVSEPSAWPRPRTVATRQL